MLGLFDLHIIPARLAARTVHTYGAVGGYTSNCDVVTGIVGGSHIKFCSGRSNEMRAAAVQWAGGSR